jgi:hypothetical protein
MNSIPEIHQLLSMGVITVVEARLLHDTYKFWPEHLIPALWPQEVTDRAQELRDKRDGMVG